MSYEDLRYNQVRQTSSHNAFQRFEGIYDQVVYWRIRSLEIDLHRGKPLRDALKKDWYVYHVAVIDPDTSVDRFSGFLQICRGIQRAMPQHEVMTVFLDIKDRFHTTATASQSAAVLDGLLIDALGEDHIYRPRDLLAREPGAASLQEAVAAQGWPTLDRLRGKFLFVVTGGGDELATYATSGTANGRVAFLSTAISHASEVPGKPHIVFYNMNGQNVRFAKNVHEAGLVSRAYYVDTKERWRSAIDHDCHHIATDHVNTRVDAWSRTRRSTGFPFQALQGYTPSVTEEGNVCGVWARSGDIWGKQDSFLYHYWDCSDHLDNEYSFYISGPNSKVDDWVKGGVMARSSLARNSPYFGVFRVGEHHGLRLQYRVAPEGPTMAEEKGLGPEGLFDADTLVFVKLSVSGEGHRARAWGSVDGHDWTELGRYEFAEPLRYQGIGVSSHGVARGAKFLFGVPHNRSRPGFDHTRFIGKRDSADRGWVAWDGRQRWRVNRFAD
jgi:hypothetical protein